jgi:hypothetical protein
VVIAAEWPREALLLCVKLLCKFRWRRIARPVLQKNEIESKKLSRTASHAAQSVQRWQHVRTTVRGCVGVTQKAVAQCWLSVVGRRDEVDASGPPWSLSLGWLAKQAHRHARLCDTELTKDCKGGTSSKRACNKDGCAEKKDAPIHQRCRDFFKRARLGREMAEWAE